MAPRSGKGCPGLRFAPSGLQPHPMNFDQRLADICARMREEKLALLVALHDGGHFIEKPNPVTVLTGFNALGASAALLRPDGACELIVTPAWDAQRVAEPCPRLRVVGTDDLVAALNSSLGSDVRAGAAIGTAGLSALPCGLASPISAALAGARAAERVVFDAARAKTIEEIALASEAARIAELGYAHLLDIARPGMSEDELALALKLHMKRLGAEDNFLLLCAGPHNRAVQPSTGRKLARGDIILAEITPSVRGQLTQICRTVTVGAPS